MNNYKEGQHIALVGTKDVLKPVYRNKNAVVLSVNHTMPDDKVAEDVWYTVKVDGFRINTLISEKCIGRYVIRIYKPEFFGDDSVYWSEENNGQILVQKCTNDKAVLLRHCRSLLKKYEGQTYCVKDMLEDRIIVGGPMDPFNIEALKEAV